MATAVNPAHEREARAFLEETLKEPVTGDLQEALKSGVLLCKFLNILKPGSVAKINTGKMPFVQMENIGNYITACKKAGLPDPYNFMTVDLWEGKNMAQVILNINSLKRHLGFGFEKAAGPGDSSKVFNHVLAEVKPTQDQTTAASAGGGVVSPRSAQATPVGADGALLAGLEAAPGHSCAVCAQPLTAAAVHACGRHYHPKCFTCKRCGVAKLASARYYEHQGQPHCDKCITLARAATGPLVRTSTKDKGFQF